MILAAGLGLRLRPLTEFLPKSMVPFSNIPFLEYIIRYLKQAGIKDIVINLHHLPKIVTDYFKNGSSFGVKINYSIEKEILGTAGGIKAAEQYLKDDLFFVINSDIAFDLNFEDVVQFHKKNNALITMVLREDKNVEKYGIIEIDPSFQIKRFLDFKKPTQTITFKKTMFTGIALFNPDVLKEFPGKGYCDISEEIYPKLIKKDLPFFGYVTDKYWLDIGSPQNYLYLQKDILSEKVFKEIRCGRQALNFKNQFNGVNIIPPVMIGENVAINKGSIIGPYTSIGNNCVIHKRCTLKNSILWDNIIIAENSNIDNSVVFDQRSIIRV